MMEERRLREQEAGMVDPRSQKAQRDKLKRKKKRQRYVQKLNRLLASPYSNTILLLRLPTRGFKTKHMTTLRSQICSNPHTHILHGCSLARKVMAANPKYASLARWLTYQVAIVFTSWEDTEATIAKLNRWTFERPLKRGERVTIDVVVPEGETILHPTQTAFFGALGVPTKILKGKIYIINSVPIVRAGDRASHSATRLCEILGVQMRCPGPQVFKTHHYGETFDPGFLENLNDADVLDMTRRGIAKVAAVSEAIGYATAASFPFTLATAYHSIRALATAIQYPLAERLTSDMYHWRTQSSDVLLIMGECK